MPVKYEREEQSFSKLKEWYEKEEASAYIWINIFHGWETEELKRLLDKSRKNALAVVNELDKLLDMIMKRRDMTSMF